MHRIDDRKLSRTLRVTSASNAMLWGVLFTIAVHMAPSPAPAQSAFFLSGIGGGGQTVYGYSGLIFSQADQLEQTGLMARFWVKTYKFSYQASLAPATSTRIDATGWGLTGEIGYQWNFDGLRIAGYAGPEYRHHDLSPNDPGSSLKNKLGAILSLDGTLPLSQNLGLDANANTSLAYNEIWLQARPYYQMSSGAKIGPDFAYIDGPDFTFTHLGFYGSGFRLAPKKFGKLYMGTELGLQYDHSRSKYDPYGGMHLSFFFLGQFRSYSVWQLWPERLRQMLSTG